MIIFDLDGTLADCEHRRHFVDPKKSENAEFKYDDLGQCLTLSGHYYHKGTEDRWKPDYKSFYEACDQDKPIHATLEVMLSSGFHCAIWSGRCESMRDKTERWLSQFMHKLEIPEIKMRPINDSTPDDQLKEKWLDQLIASGGKVDFVFDDRPKVVRMWRHRGIFVFNCNQTGEEF